MAIIILSHFNAPEMNLTAYPLKSDATFMAFTFISKGPKGTIYKIINYSKMHLEGLYNIAFGDKDKNTGGINDTSISNNADIEIVLATVVRSIYIFTDHYPKAYVYATGSTKTRTRLYRIWITKYLNEIKRDFQLFGLKDEVIEHFIVNEPYDAFIITRKKLPL
ncbi:MAG: DUF6934 family protein [Bacteroidota bacterium]